VRRALGVPNRIPTTRAALGLPSLVAPNALGVYTMLGHARVGVVFPQTEIGTDADVARRSIALPISV
jgi:hypothetical protein